MDITACPKCESHKITKAEFNIKRRRIEEKIRAMDSRMRVLQGGIAKEKRHLEEKTEEKRKNKKRSEKKRKELSVLRVRLRFSKAEM